MSVLEQEHLHRTPATRSGRSWWQAGLIGVGTAAVANTVIYVVARLVGVSFHIVDGGDELRIGIGDALFLTIVPMVVGVALVMLVSRWWLWALRVGAVIGAGLALATIALPYTVDEASGGTRAALAVLHIPVAVGIVLALESYRRQRLAAAG